MMAHELPEPSNVADLDAGTLRALARLLDFQADVYGQRCRCAIHAALIQQCKLYADEYRTWAFRARGGSATSAPLTLGPTTRLEATAGALPLLINWDEDPHGYGLRLEALDVDPDESDDPDPGVARLTTRNTDESVRLRLTRGELLQLVTAGVQILTRGGDR